MPKAPAKTKSTKIRPPLPLLGVLFILALVLVSSYGSTSAKPSFSLDPGNLGNLRHYFASQITKLGATQAYEDFKKEAATKPQTTQHSLAHLFGETLYQQTGPEGITVCDNSFAFGCYHSFFGSAIASQGEGIIKSLDQACVKKFSPLGTGCQHGIGHGLVEYLGPKNLAEALEDCLTIQKFLLLGCTSGAFMEFNFPTLTSDNNTSTTSRPLDQADPFQPCSTTDSKFKSSCFFELPEWWYQPFQKDLSKMGNLCQRLAGADLDYCFRGLGAVIGQRQSYDLEKSVSDCSLMPSAEGRVLCLAGVSWSFYAEPTKRTNSTEPCQGLTEPNRKTCLEKGDLLREVY